MGGGEKKRIMYPDTEVKQIWQMLVTGECGECTGVHGTILFLGFKIVRKSGEKFQVL